MTRPSKLKWRLKDNGAKAVSLCSVPCDKIVVRFCLLTVAIVDYQNKFIYLIVIICNQLLCVGFPVSLLGDSGQHATCCLSSVSVIFIFCISDSQFCLHASFIQI